MSNSKIERESGLPASYQRTLCNNLLILTWQTNKLPDDLMIMQCCDDYEICDSNESDPYISVQGNDSIGDARTSISAGTKGCTCGRI